MHADSTKAENICIFSKQMWGQLSGEWKPWKQQDQTASQGGCWEPALIKQLQYSQTFNLDMEQFVIPSCFKQSIIVSVSKKLSLPILQSGPTSKSHLPQQRKHMLLLLICDACCRWSTWWHLTGLPGITSCHMSPYCLSSKDNKRPITRAHGI